ncbi:MAG: hypothetical protein ACRDHM_05955 [Actinomycetota bacterium]
MPPEPILVWMVREGDPTATEGTLSIDGRTLVFRPSAAAADGVEIQIQDIGRVRRARGSPFLTVTLTGPERPQKLFVYFAKPPPLPGERPTVPIPIFRAPRGLERSAAALSLRATNRLFRNEIDSWVRALRERSRGS